MCISQVLLYTSSIKSTFKQIRIGALCTVETQQKQRRCQPVCVIIPETIPSKALESNQTTVKRHSKKIHSKRILKSSFTDFPGEEEKKLLRLNWVPRIMEWVAHYVSKRVVQFPEHLENNYKLYTELFTEKQRHSCKDFSWGQYNHIAQTNCRNSVFAHMPSNKYTSRNQKATDELNLHFLFHCPAMTY